MKANNKSIKQKSTKTKKGISTSMALFNLISKAEDTIIKLVAACPMPFTQPLNPQVKDVGDLSSFIEKEITRHQTLAYIFKQYSSSTYDHISDVQIKSSDIHKALVGSVNMVIKDGKKLPVIVDPEHMEKIH